jgi:PadR family transcriptional regulator PadR
MKFSSELLKGVTKNIILATISHKEMYGYDIAKSVKEKSDALVEVGEGSLYPALHELEKKGLVKSRWMSVGGRERKYYTITPKGSKALSEAGKEWNVFSKTITPFFPRAV